MDLEDILGSDETIKDEPIKEPTQTQEEPVSEEVEEPKPQPEVQPEQEENKEQKENGIGALRKTYAETKKLREYENNTMKRFINGEYDLKVKDFKTEEGLIDYKAFNEAMDKVDSEALAKKNNITPELQAKIDEIEAVKKEQALEKAKLEMGNQLIDLRQKLSLTEADVNQFFVDASKRGINPFMWLHGGNKIEDLYKLVYFDREVNKRAEELAKSPKAPVVVNPQPTTSQTISWEDFKNKL